MMVRLRISYSLGNYFAAIPWCSLEMDQLPSIGDPFQDKYGSYRIVKVLEDVDPEYGSECRGPVAFIMRVGLDVDAFCIPIDCNKDMSFQINTAKEMRDCINRANAARKSRNIKQYQRHVEEFIFLSNVISSESRSPDQLKKAIMVPFIPVYCSNLSIATMIRQQFIQSCFAAHITPVSSLSELIFSLDRVDVVRPTLFIITGPISLNWGLIAHHLIRTHAKSRECRILAMVQHGHRFEEILALAAGADACVSYPESPEQYETLINCIKDLLQGSVSQYGNIALEA